MTGDKSDSVPPFMAFRGCVAQRTRSKSWGGGFCTPFCLEGTKKGGDFLVGSSKSGPKKRKGSSFMGESAKKMALARDNTGKVPCGPEECVIEISKEEFSKSTNDGDDCEDISGSGEEEIIALSSSSEEEEEEDRVKGPKDDGASGKEHSESESESEYSVIFSETESENSADKDFPRRDSSVEEDEDEDEDEDEEEECVEMNYTDYDLSSVDAEEGHEVDISREKEGVHTEKSVSEGECIYLGSSDDEESGWYERNHHVGGVAGRTRSKVVHRVDGRSESARKKQKELLGCRSEVKDSEPKIKKDKRIQDQNLQGRSFCSNDDSRKNKCRRFGKDDEDAPEEMMVEDVNTSSSCSNEVGKEDRQRAQKDNVGGRNIEWKKTAEGFYQFLINSVWQEEDAVKNLISEPRRPSQEPNEVLPRLFTFTFEEEKPVERPEHEKELDELWAEMEFNLRSAEIGSTCRPTCTDEDEALADHSLCPRGKHQIILDEEIGRRCLLCSYVETEIRYVCPPMEKFSLPTRSYLRDKYRSPLDLQFEASEDDFEEQCTETGTVWDLIPGIRRSMYPHQQEGFEFMWKNLGGSTNLEELRTSKPKNIGGCIISHEPGTGKTRLTLVFLKAFIEQFPNSHPVIIAPANMLLTWEEEFKKWNIGIPFHNLNNEDFSHKENADLLKQIVENPHLKSKNNMRMVKVYSWSKSKSVLGLSYNLFRQLTVENFEPLVESKERETSCRKILLEIPGIVVLDEGHTARNDGSILWNQLLKLRTERRIILSGTPFQNNFIELANTFTLVRPELKKFCLKGKKNATGDHSIEKLRAKMAPYVHVYKGGILQQNLPGFRDCVLVLNPVHWQANVLKCAQAWEGSEDTFRHKQTLVSVHPSLLVSPGLSLSGKEKKSLESEMEQLKSRRLDPNEGAKTKFTVELIRLSLAMKEKVLVFSEYLEPLSLIMDHLRSIFNWTEGVDVLRIDGQLSQRKRQKILSLFNDPESQARVLLVSIKSCSQGINIVGASRVILLDVDWNPSVERQAISRAYRLGQQRVVYAYHLIMKGTYEFEKYLKQTEKQRLSELVFAATDGGNSDLGTSTVVTDDKILDEMTSHVELKGLFDRIINQPQEMDLTKNFSSAALS